MLLVGLLAGCPNCNNPAPSPDASTPDGAVPDGGGRDSGRPDASYPFDAGPDDGGSFCDLPGSILSTPNGQVIIPGMTQDPSEAFITVPVGFCLHYFGNVGNARQIRFAP